MVWFGDCSLSAPTSLAFYVTFYWALWRFAPGGRSAKSFARPSQTISRDFIGSQEQTWYYVVLST